MTDELIARLRGGRVHGDSSGESSVDDVAGAVERSRAAQREWAARPVAQRAAVLLRFHDLMLRSQDEILDLLQWEVGKTRMHALTEVSAVPMVARHYGRRGAYTCGTSGPGARFRC